MRGPPGECPQHCPSPQLPSSALSVNPLLAKGSLGPFYPLVSQLTHLHLYPGSLKPSFAFTGPMLPGHLP